MSKPTAEVEKKLEEEKNKKLESDKKPAANEREHDERKSPVKQVKKRRSLAGPTAGLKKNTTGSSEPTASSAAPSNRSSVFKAKQPAKTASSSESAASRSSNSSSTSSATAPRRPAVFKADASASPAAILSPSSGAVAPSKDRTSPPQSLFHEEDDDAAKDTHKLKKPAATEVRMPPSDHSASGSEFSDHESGEEEKESKPLGKADKGDKTATPGSHDEDDDTGSRLKARAKPAAAERKALSEDQAEPELESVERKPSPPKLKARAKPAASERKGPFSILKDECIDRIDAYEKTDRPDSYRTRISGFFSSKRDTRNLTAKHEVVNNIKALIRDWSLVVTSEDTLDESYKELILNLQQQIVDEEITAEQAEEKLEIEIQVDKTIELLLALTKFADEAQKNVALSFYITSATKVGITSNTKIAIDEMKDKIWKYLANNLPKVHDALVTRVLSMLENAEKLDKNAAADAKYLDISSNKNRFKNKSAQMEYEADQIYPISKAREALYTNLRKSSSNKP